MDVNVNSQIKNGKIVKYTNCILIDNGIQKRDDLWVRDGIILDGAKVYYCERRRPDIEVDCKGSYLCPGFIDLQINGGYGFDFASDPHNTKHHTSTLAKKLLKTGVTAFCPTVVTSPSELYHEVLPQIESTEASVEGAAILGAHLEGPFINVNRKGAHEAGLIRDLKGGINAVLDMYGPSLKNAKIVTLAPELEGSQDVIRELDLKHGICVSLGHSAATLVDGEAGVLAGARMITHLFNAMLPYHHRDPHLVGLLTSTRSNRQIYYGIIADAIHTHPSALRLAWRANAEGLVLVTDAMSAFGLGPGVYKLGNKRVEVKTDGRACLTDQSETLAGSTATMPLCIWNLQKLARCSLPLAIKAATRTPAKTLGMSIGGLSVGYRADLVIIDSDTVNQRINVNATITDGFFAHVSSEYQPEVRVN